MRWLQVWTLRVSVASSSALDLNRIGPVRDTLALSTAISNCGSIGFAAAQTTSSAGGIAPDASTQRIGVARISTGQIDQHETDLGHVI